MRVQSVNKLVETITVSFGGQTAFELSYDAIEHLYREVQKAKKEGKPAPWTLKTIQDWANS